MIAYKYFIDTAPYIYCLEGDNSLSNKTKEFFKEIYISNANFTTSSITYEEYLVHPYKNKDYDCIKRFKAFLETTETNIVYIDESVAERAAKIRAEYTSFRAMDALQLASACLNNCDVFVTNDKQLRQFKDIKIQLIDEL